MSDMKINLAASRIRIHVIEILKYKQHYADALYDVIHILLENVHN